MMRQLLQIIVLAVLFGQGLPSEGLCQSTSRPPASNVPQQIISAVASNMGKLSKVQEVKKLASAQAFRAATLYLSGSEIIVQRLFDRQHPEYVRFGVALRRSTLSEGANIVADQELGKLTERTRRFGASWIHSIISTLQRSSSCYNSVWIDSLIPLLELPEGREIVQDYIFRAVQRWSEGGTFSWACPTLKSSDIHQQRFAIDLFYIYLYTIPDPIEAMMLYQNMSDRITILQSRVTLAFAMTKYYQSPAANLKLSDYPPETYSEQGDPSAIRAIKDALTVSGSKGR